MPRAFTLGQNYPNPFNPSTTISFEIPEHSQSVVSLRVYNIRGQLVKTLVKNQVLLPGNHAVQWEGDDNSGRKVSTGVYFYRMEAGDFARTKKMVLVK